MVVVDRKQERIVCCQVVKDQRQTRVVSGYGTTNNSAIRLVKECDGFAALHDGHRNESTQIVLNLLSSSWKSFPGPVLFLFFTFQIFAAQEGLSKGPANQANRASSDSAAVASERSRTG